MTDFKPNLKEQTCLDLVPRVVQPTSILPRSYEMPSETWTNSSIRIGRLLRWGILAALHWTLMSRGSQMNPGMN